MHMFSLQASQMFDCFLFVEYTKTSCCGVLNIIIDMVRIVNECIHLGIVSSRCQLGVVYDNQKIILFSNKG